VYIKSSKTNTAEFEPTELIENFRKGLVQVTNGPLIEYTVDGKSPGTLVTAGAPGLDNVKRVAVDLKVFGPNWITISRISVQANGRFIKQIMIPSMAAGTEGGMIFPRKDFPEEGKFNILVARDCVLEILAESDPASRRIRSTRTRFRPATSSVRDSARLHSARRSLSTATTTARSPCRRT
jgi:hypothetical protein